jgi:tetratricopeptide (TPR) repeat protein
MKLKRCVWGVAGVVVAAMLLVAWWRGRPERHLAFAAQRLSVNEPGEAIVWLEVPLQTPATRDRALLLRARAALTQGQIREAVRALDAVDSQGPWATDVAFWKGRTLYASKQTMWATAWFRRALASRPGDAEIHRWLAAASYDLGDRFRAMSSLEAVTQIEPADPRAWRTLALLYKEDADRGNARAAYETTLRLDPNQPWVRLELAETLIALGLPLEAERQLGMCRGNVPEEERITLLVRCLRARGEKEEVRSLLDRALSSFPLHPALLAERGGLDLAEGRPSEAAERFSRALQADPYDGRLYFQRGQAYSALGRKAEAERDMARSAEFNKNMAELSKLDEQACRNPTDPEVRYRLGRLCRQMGKPDLAASWLRAALACDSKQREARLRLGSPDGF